MGLLFHNLSKEFQDVADLVYESHFEMDPKMQEEYSDYRKEKMYEDIMHNLSFLEVSYRLEDATLFHEYAKWLYELMYYLMPDLGEERVKEQMILHYQLLAKYLKETLDPKAYMVVESMLNDAITSTKDHQIKNKNKKQAQDPYYIHKRTYLNHLLEGESKKAIDYILELKATSIPIEDIYDDILSEVMHQIGELWHEQKITVDQEHYMTSITQVALSQFYDTIFSTQRNQRKVIACSVGSELHEMGARMISDLLEYHGWDSTYLGASVPEKVLLKRIEETQPDLVVLSVTMPQHLLKCELLVRKIHALDHAPKIAVGGQAFNMAQGLWKKWPVDISTNNAKNLLRWVQKEF